MATKVTSHAPTKPAAPEPSLVERANQSIATAKTGFDPLRPARYGIAFVSGTLKDGLNGIARWGSIGLRYGIMAGIVVGIALPTVGILSGIALVGGSMFAAGALGGGIRGFATGGMKAVGRIHRGEKYAEDLIQRSQIQQEAPPNRRDYRAHHHAHQDRKNAILLQNLEREAERRRDAEIYSNPNTYWQDRVQASRVSNTQGMEL